MDDGAHQTERRLGSYLAAHPIALEWARGGCAAAWRYVSHRAAAGAPPYDERKARVHEAVGRVAARNADGAWAQAPGRIPPEVDAARAVLQGVGHLRELMTQLRHFATEVLLADVVDPDARTDWRACADAAGFDAEAIERAVRRGLAHRRLKTSGAVEERDLEPGADVFDAPWHPIVRAMRAMRRPRGLDDAWSRDARATFVAEGGTLSPVEKTLSGLEGPTLPWADERRRFSLDEDHPWVREARAAGFPLCTGIAAEAVRFLMLDRMMGLQGPLEARVACLGYLLPTGTHSFHEVMDAARGVGCDYEGRCDYGDVPPMHRAELAAVVDAPPGAEILRPSRYPFAGG